jgi:uncharacterized RmlC-like cupin family protein
MSAGVRRITPEERTEGAATPGMTREEAVATDGLWAGFVRTDAGTLSGWHHHGDFESVIFVITGALVMEYGPGGRETLQARPGDFLYVAPGAIHRESNPTAEESHIIVVRSGSGEAVINVDGPESATDRQA